MTLTLLALAACSGGGSSQAALLQQGLAGDLAACAALRDPDSRGQCTSGAVEALAPQDLDAALAACAALGSPWLEECTFRAADAAEVWGAQAAALCPRTGRYVGQCLGHAAAREAEQLFAQPGREPEALEQLTLRVQGYRKGRRADLEARGLAARVIGQREPTQPFSQGHCGRAELDLCVMAYTQRALLQAPAEDLCAGRAPWPAIHPDAADLGARARAALCSPKSPRTTPP